MEEAVAVVEERAGQLVLLRLLIVELGDPVVGESVNAGVGVAEDFAPQLPLETIASLADRHRQGMLGSLRDVRGASSRRVASATSPKGRTEAGETGRFPPAGPSGDRRPRMRIAAHRVTTAREVFMRYVLPRLTVLTGFAALTCVVMPAAFAAIPSPAPTTFGPSGSSIDARCLVAATVRSTASQQGCLERVVTGAVRLRVVVRADPPPSYRIRLLACTALNACNAAISTVVRSEPPPADSPARAMTRLTLTVARAALGPGATRICARQDPFPPLGAPSDAALLGGQAFANDYAGGFEATVGKEGVIVEGWIINPRSNAPVKIEVRRGAMTRTAAARLAYPRSKASFPDFDGFHGFRLLLPFVGRGGSYESLPRDAGLRTQDGR